jgi:hypothetical protein
MKYGHPHGISVTGRRGTVPRIQMSGGRYTVGLVNAAEHWQAWLERYGADYSTDEERRAAYRDFKGNLARLTEMVSGQEHDH